MSAHGPTVEAVEAAGRVLAAARHEDDWWLSQGATYRTAWREKAAGLFADIETIRANAPHILTSHDAEWCRRVRLADSALAQAGAEIARLKVVLEAVEALCASQDELKRMHDALTTIKPEHRPCETEARWRFAQRVRAALAAALATEDAS